jgi:hypothetical protein
MLRLLAALALAGCKPAPSPPPPSGGPDLRLYEVCPPKTPAEVVRRAEAEKTLADECDRAAAALKAGTPAPVSAALAADAAKFRAALDYAARRAHECRAVGANAPAACGPIADTEKRNDCQLLVAFYQAAKRAPKDPAWRMPDAWHAHCHAAAGAACDAYRDALRAGDPAKCPKQPAALADCAALAALDAARCPDDGCKSRVARDKLIAEGGLARLADAGPDRDRPLAAAALGREDACEPVFEAFAAVCTSAPHVGAAPVAR